MAASRRLLLACRLLHALERAVSTLVQHSTLRVCLVSCCAWHKGPHCTSICTMYVLMGSLMHLHYSLSWRFAQAAVPTSACAVPVLSHSLRLPCSAMHPDVTIPNPSGSVLLQPLLCACHQVPWLCSSAALSLPGFTSWLSCWRLCWHVASLRLSQALGPSTP